MALDSYKNLANFTLSGKLTSEMRLKDCFQCKNKGTDQCAVTAQLNSPLFFFNLLSDSKI